MIRRLKILPFLVPVLCLLAAYAAMRPDALLARPDIPGTANRLVYDESDLTAFALRGLNQQLGRLPGRLDEPQDPDWVIPPTTFPQKLREPQPPFQSRYYLEYPTPALLLFWAGYALQSPVNRDSVPAIVADGHQFSIAFYAPRTPFERRLWTRLHDAVQVYMALGAIGLIALMLVLARGYESGQSWGGPYWLAAFPAAVFFSLNRYDVFPTLALAGAFAALGRDQRGRTGVFLGIGVLLKLFPVVFVPVIVRYLGVRRSVRFLAGLAGTVLIGFGISALLLGVEATLGPILVQLARPYEARSWTFYDRLLPVSLAEEKVGRLLILALTVVVCVWTRPRSRDAVLRRCTVILTVFVVLAVFWSPQWVLWFLPFLIPLGRNRWWPIGLAVLLDTTTYFTFPVLFWNLIGLSPFDFSLLAETMIYVRGALWFALVVGLLFDEYRERSLRHPATALARFHAEREQRLAAFLQLARTRGLPRGLHWTNLTSLGEPLLVHDREERCLALLVPLEATFTPEPGSAMEEVPQAREPRPITVIFRYQRLRGPHCWRRRWQTDGRAIFNLRPEQVIARSEGRFKPVQSI
ncbi:MAG: DUF2029 domain-containing protein [Bacteroidales bacterium]|nr:DUF2029 domain-containing protein [Bacteroidales bacterium]